MVKFDHYCLLINTAVGDKNHAKFLAYCILEWYLIMWGWMLAWHAVRPCYNMFNLEAAVSLLQHCKFSRMHDDDSHCAVQLTSLHLPLHAWLRAALAICML